MEQIAILGAGSWGSALAVLLESKKPWLWDHRPERAAEIESTRLNSYLPGVPLPASIRITGDLECAWSEAQTVVLAVPSHALREVARRGARFDAGERQVVVNVAKGLELGSGLRPSQVLRQELPHPASHVVSLVGPSHAEEVARGMPTTVVVAGEDEPVLQQVQDLFTTENFRVYTNTDLLGVELAVSLKNVIAIAAGICDGLGFGDNSRGALLTRGLAEIARLGLALGARGETFSGLAGLGDLVTTATSHHSRNRNLGEAIGKGATLQEALTSIGQVAEGVRTTRATRDLAREHDVEMPISTQVFQILFEAKEPRVALRDLMLRTPKREDWSEEKGVT